MKLERNANYTAEQAKTGPVTPLISELDRAADMIALVDDFSYRRQSNGSGSVGAQFRHNLDFIGAFLKGVKIGRIDYGKRGRDFRIENDRSAAIAQVEVLKAMIEKLETRSMLNSISVRSEIEISLWFPSSVSRELEFVHSHTVHHHALIAEKLFGLGIHVEKDFGVAPSTLQYWKKQAA
jgi:hypothetical protein